MVGGASVSLLPGQLYTGAVQVTASSSRYAHKHTQARTALGEVACSGATLTLRVSDAEGTHASQASMCVNPEGECTQVQCHVCGHTHARRRAPLLHVSVLTLCSGPPCLCQSRL